MIQITSRVLYLTREDWGADPLYPPLGGPPIARVSRTHLITHHTVTIDADATRNVWESLDEVKRHMRRLQVIRPDLGLDVPYSFVLFPMADGTIVICEGRGFDRAGAHTAGGFDRNGNPTMDQAAIRAGGQWHNVTGLATSVAGNHQEFGPDFAPYVTPYGQWLTYVKFLCPNVEQMRPQRAVSWGHRDFYQTACPGQHVYNELPNVKIGSVLEEDMNIQILCQGAKKDPHDVSHVVFLDGNANVKRNDVNSAGEYEALVAGGYPVKPSRTSTRYRRSKKPLVTAPLAWHKRSGSRTAVGCGPTAYRSTEAGSRSRRSPAARRRHPGRPGRASR